jgi:hypothetical protein
VLRRAANLVIHPRRRGIEPSDVDR